MTSPLPVSLARFRGLSLLPRQLLVKTGPVDHADWNYRGLLGAIQRVRFRLALRLLEGRSCDRLLEIGYGSGVFAPELKRHCRSYYGVDVHGHQGQVAEALHRVGVEAALYQCSVTELPFEDGFFDCVVGISVLEFVDRKHQACLEIRRVLGSRGRFILVTPGDSALVDLGARMLTGRSPGKDFGRGREEVARVLKVHFEELQAIDYPLAGLPGLCLYHALLMRPRTE